MLRARITRDRWTIAVGLAAAVYLSGASHAAQGASASIAQESAQKSVWDAVYSDAQAARGQDVYQQECAGCHLDSLGGADMAPAMVGDAFLTAWDDLSVGDLFERIRVSMPQDSPAHLSRQAYIDVVAYLLKANKFPSGPNELVSDLQTIKAIKIIKK
jgi:mono/diheme cytochrome c family protein